MKISKTTIFFSGIFVGHFIISPIKDGRAKILFDKLTDSKTGFNDDNKKKIGVPDIYHNKSNGDDESSEYSRSNTNNRSNLINRNNDSYWQSRGYSERPDDWQNDNGGNSGYSKDELNNHANQMNPNNEAYHSSRGK
ncbi:hypothetical protein [uncultured Chryseobacterium sp.]|uniref:hypothetical protein n=1 Tax=uncultured Chryseobacterium sp. TaxID=259322 RepID=UPI0025CE06FA|nr:hypothetical protein [uncultured Chryseobacterium sp.]